MKVLVTGGRTYADEINVNKTLTRLHTEHPISLLIEGGAKGADRLARHWAVRNNVQYRTVEANWNHHGKIAGIIRNEQMIQMKPDLVVAFPGGKGTAHMMKLAERYGVKLKKVEPSVTVYARSANNA